MMSYHNNVIRVAQMEVGAHTVDKEELFYFALYMLVVYVGG